MHSEYSLPPGYGYQVDAGDDGTARLTVIDRAGHGVLSVPHVGFDTSVNGFKLFCYLSHANPEWLRHHTAAFMVWRVNESPLDYSARRNDEAEL